MFLFIFLGQFYDLLELFNVGGDVKDTNYIFMVKKTYFSNVYKKHVFKLYLSAGC